MSYYLNLFSPETYARFSDSDRTVSGFRERQRNAAEKIQPGDVLLCYLTRLSRWMGLFRVESGPFNDHTPIFTTHDDPFYVRFKVVSEIWLPLETAIPIHDDSVWPKLSITKDHSRASATWTGFFRASLNRFDDEDGALIEHLLREQEGRRKQFAFTDKDKKALVAKRVRRSDGEVTVTVPDDNDEVSTTPSRERESIQMQALLAEIGATMGCKIWLPVNDRGPVLRVWKTNTDALVDALPLNYDTTTLDTIERIDVLWLKGRSIVRAFEVEHTTAIYSGLLRMADLLSLQPNMDIKLHIVAPEVRKAKVFEEIQRPVFSLLERKPLAKTCLFLSYDAVRELATSQHLAYLSDAVLDKYAEEAE